MKITVTLHMHLFIFQTMLQLAIMMLGYDYNSSSYVYLYGGFAVGAESQAQINYVSLLIGQQGESLGALK